MASEAPEVHGEPARCEAVGEGMPDIAGYGVLIGFSVQAFISLTLSIWTFFLTKFGHLDIQNPEGSAEHANEVKRLGFVSEILMIGNDLQMITGLALISTALANGREIDLYHLHLVYDTVSFVGISNAAALVCWTFMRAQTAKERCRKLLPAHWNGRFRISYAFAVLFLVLTVILEIRLDEWTLSAEEPGRCYITKGIAIPGADHPTTDKAYVAITAIWLLLVMFGALFASVKFRKPLLLLSALQFPVHLYMMIRLRYENYPYLEEGEDENRWDFGQTTATILLAITVGQLIRQSIEYVKFERALERYGPAYALSPGDKDYGSPSLVEEGLRKIKGTQQSESTLRLERNTNEGRDEESYELIDEGSGRRTPGT